MLHSYKNAQLFGTTSISHKTVRDMPLDFHSKSVFIKSAYFSQLQYGVLLNWM